MIIDAHTHPYTSPLPQEITTAFTSAFRKGNLSLLADAFESFKPNDYSDELIADMNATVVEKAIVVSVPPIVTNEFTRGIVEKHKDRLIWFMGLNPILEVHETVEEMERAAKEGSRGIGEIVGGYNFFPRLDNPLGDDKFIEILDKAGQLRLPLLIHSCWGRHVWLKYSDPICIDDFATSCPDTTLIIAHSGGTYQRFNEGAIMVARKNPNVYLETSWTSTRIVEKMVKEVGAEKIIFASDWGSYYPRKISRMLKLVQLAGISREDKELILSKNIAEILNISTSQIGSRGI